MKARITYLDGLRGVAILLVVGYHVYTRWASSLPYGDVLAGVPVFFYGWLGVPLFFLISGFVIFMTLEKCDGIASFLYRRWLRLFPAMLICTIIIYLSAGFLSERPAGSPSLLSIVPGLLFIEPTWIEAVFNLPIVPLEGAFWSLYVEFKFYVLAALIYFLLDRRRFTTYIFLLFVLAVGLKVVLLVSANSYVVFLSKAAGALSLGYFGYFAAGAEFYKYERTKLGVHLYSGLLMSIVSVVGLGRLDLLGYVAAIFVSLLFFMVVVSERLKAILNFKILLYFGAISYPLYLLHQNIIVGAIIKIGLGGLVGIVVVPIVLLSLVSLIAFIIAKYLEDPLRNKLMQAFSFRAAVAR